MNKKVLSAILFSALFAGTGTFTSCIDNDEPAGIENLRGAKAELIRAKVAVEQANATYILAQAEVEKAKAAKENAIAEIKKAEADYQKLLNEYQEATNDLYKAEIAADLEAAKQAAAEAALRHQKTILTLETQLAKAQREYEITMKQIEIAKALMNEGDLQTIEELEGIVEGKQAAVNSAMVAVKAAEMQVYNAAMNLEADSDWWAEKLALDLKYAEAGLAAAEEAVETYKNYLDNLENADWYAEIKEIQVELDSIADQRDVLDVAKTKELNSDEHIALIDAKKAAEKALAEIEVPVTAEELKYAYKYLDGSEETETIIAKGTALTDAVELIAGENAVIDALKNEIASYTTEKKYWLDSIAAKDAATQTAIDKAAATAVENWTKALAAYDAANKAKPLSKDAIFKAGEKATDPDTGAAVVYTESVIAADAKKASGAYTEAEYNEAILLAKQKFADALVAWYNTLPATQVTFRTITLGTVVDSETIYASKTVKEWLSDASLKHKNLDKLYAYFNGQMDALWNVGAKAEEKNTNGSVKTATTGAFATWTDKDGLVAAAETTLKTASDVAFGPAVNYYGTTVVTGAAQWYLHNKPTLEDIKYVFNKGLSVGAYGLNVLGEDENIDFIANNYKDIIADYEAAIEFWTAAVEDWTEAKEAYDAEVETATAAVTAAQKAITDAEEAIDLKYAAAEEALDKRAIVLTNIKNKLEQYVDVDTNGYATVEDWLAAAVKGAEYYVIEAKKAVVEVEQNLKMAEDGKFNTALALENAEQNLAAATEELEKAQAELAEALANLETALAIMSAE